MLQVRAGRCPGCKEEAPPGAEYCPICGEYLGWQTTSGKNIPRDKISARRRSKTQSAVRLLIFFFAACLFSLLTVRVFNSPSNSIIEMPPLQSTSASSNNTTSDNSVSDNATSDNSLTGNSSTNNSVSDNAASDNASTPTAENELSDLELQ